MVGVSDWKRGSRTGANGRWAAAAGTFVELAASALVEADSNWGVVGVAQAPASACITHPTKFHFTQAVCGIREQYSLERAQGMGDGFQKLTCASTALDSKSESAELTWFYSTAASTPLRVAGFLCVRVV